MGVFSRMFGRRKVYVAPTNAGYAAPAAVPAAPVAGRQQVTTTTYTTTAPAATVVGPAGATTTTVVRRRRRGRIGRIFCGSVDERRNPSVPHHPRKARHVDYAYTDAPAPAYAPAAPVVATRHY